MQQYSWDMTPFDETPYSERLIRSPLIWKCLSRDSFEEKREKAGSVLDTPQIKKSRSDVINMAIQYG